MSQRTANSRLYTPPAPPAQLDGKTQQALGVAHDVAGATYFQKKLLQPVWKQILFGPNTGSTVNYEWKSSDWEPMSVLVVNPNPISVYVSPPGPNPVSQGVAYPPLTSLRIPIAAGRGLSIGLDSSVNLAETQYLVHLFLYPTAD